MTLLVQKIFEKISSLSEEKQNILAIYIQNHLYELLAQAEKEKYREDIAYNINDFNEETQQAIRNIEEQKNLTFCESKNDLYNQLDI
jgi:hypothetical protein